MTTHGPGPSDATYRYRWVADELRKKINSGAHGPGERLPTQGELASEYGVSRATVIQALDLLRERGLIVTRQGSGTFVKRRPPAVARPAEGEDARDGHGADGDGADGDELWAVVSERVPPVVLSPYLEEAFAARDVTLDVYSMTTESLATRVTDQKARIVSGRSRPPRSIRARLILPDARSPHLSIPRRTDGTDDPRVRERLRGILQAHATMLREALYELRNRGFVPKVSVEVRQVQTAPQLKLYILNRRLALQGFYIPEEGTVTLPPDNEEVTILDAYGTGATLFPFRATADPTQAGIVHDAQEFFDQTWKNKAKKADF
ncbi:GntR family transcriptional regulator [Streptomyces sp. MUM 178J]|uniref:GntR family transcriptional regulator n=1 Tax=Streptomyces sp. MUM 178J TaxID=2791991 RepID=UPI001F03F001|nr:GntR family transcriptional regulator [Streptomyces sp. MUM 178J]WRQ82992.1 GntR family transcriptional regulator [Streptomyces sp. MUM 178J]